MRSLPSAGPAAGDFSLSCRVSGRAPQPGKPRVPTMEMTRRAWPPRARPSVPALGEALTGTNPDRREEEKRRGITIDLGFAFLDLGDVRLGLVDVPGHERFVRNMLAGVGGIDLVLLVIAADESIKPQTREHFDICRLLQIRRGVVALPR